jgi:hypothetical protein
MVSAARFGTFVARNTSVFTTFGTCIAKDGNRRAVSSCIAPGERHPALDHPGPTCRQPTLPAAPNGGYLRATRRPAQVTERDSISDRACGQIAE